MVGRNLVEHPDAHVLEVIAPSSQELDLRDYANVLRYMEHHRPDVVVHAAGRVGGIQANIAQPVRFLLDNLDMGRNVIVASHACGVRKLINLGSSCMYPRNAQNPLREEMILQGELEPTNEGYALAKITAARLCDYIRREDDQCRYKTLVPSNIYGKYDSFDPAKSHMIPAVIHKIHVAKTGGDDEVVIWGDGKARREFMYAGDLAHCLVQAILRIDKLPGTLNAGTGVDYTIDEYYRAIADVVGYKGRFVHDLSKPVGMARKLVSVERAHAWGWQAKTSLRDGLEKTYAYYLESVNGRH
jgi:GDP-L-fucose synthase